MEYKRESFTLFEEMMEHFEEETVRYLYMMRVVDENGDEVSYAATVGGNSRRPDETLQRSAPVLDGMGGTAEELAPRRMQTSLDDVEKQFQRRKARELEQARRAGAGVAEAIQQVVRGEKVGRNDPCPCGSGKNIRSATGRMNKSLANSDWDSGVCFGVLFCMSSPPVITERASFFRAEKRNQLLGYGFKAEENRTPHEGIAALRTFRCNCHAGYQQYGGRTRWVE